MLVTFLGAPCSGKTTTAARLFADLKEQGLPAEFLAEYARYYIAERRAESKFSGLDDADQWTIMKHQAAHEGVMTADPSSLVIADSCAMSALLYMTPEYIEWSQHYGPLLAGGQGCVDLAKWCAQKYDVIFRCSPVRPGLVYRDANRLHSYEESLELDKRIDAVFDLVGIDRSKVFPIFGDPKMRVTEASSVVMRKVVDSLAQGVK